MDLLSVFEKNMNKNELHCLAKSLHDSYEPLMQDYQVWNIIDALAPDDVMADLRPMQVNIIGHRIINDLIMKYYHCEKVIKYHLVRRFQRRKRDVTVFEMNIDNSRLDIGRINGDSYGYEIKTELDNLSKLHKQINDYSKVIEYVYVVTHPKHLSSVLEIIPEYCGINVYNLTAKRFFLKEVRPASKSPNIHTKAQIRNLASRDIEFILKKLGIRQIPTTRNERENILADLLGDIDFNNCFKEALKNKFRDRWEYLKGVFGDIQPIDAQVFFATPADPYWVYYKNSSIV